MISLKTFCETLSPYVGVSPNGLYERQRELVKIGALPQPVRGRGHGLSATPETVATLLTAVMATDNLSDLALHYGLVANAKAKGRGCKFTGETVFVAAVAKILANEEWARSVTRIQVFRADHAARIRFNEPLRTSKRREPVDDPYQSDFGKPSDFPRRLEIDAILWGNVLEKIVELLKSTMEEH